MRASSLTSGDFGLGPGLKVADVGCGTGFTTIGVVEQGVAAADIHMLDQSPQQLSKARVKPELQNVVRQATLLHSIVSMCINRPQATRCPAGLAITVLIPVTVTPAVLRPNSTTQPTNQPTDHPDQPTNP